MISALMAQSQTSRQTVIHHSSHELEHLRQLNAINTMVGTAQANTQTAGRFGKGSEEHGQTIPAVLVPNGQNSWTPQTQDTEQKCISPYYYEDTQLQGFRNSHWIVGGCAQDYGSFTIAALSGELRLQPEDRATRFFHEDEISHPHYYSVELRDEHLKAELTALSHAAILRVTPDAEGDVHLVINPNSDESQGYVEVDTAAHLVYGYNPVYRIYQGWVNLPASAVISSWIMEAASWHLPVSLTRVESSKACQLTRKNVSAPGSPSKRGHNSRWSS